MSETSPKSEQDGNTSNKVVEANTRKGLMRGFLDLLTDGLEQIEDKVRNRKNETEAGPGPDESEAS